ncbi:MAG: RecX family transcriptional regulator [Alphaproteobacteria bacterium]|nr:RecX family transcriptional regulator [Alphaproteobacteria bacterium]
MPGARTAVKPITQKRLTNVALYYLGRYESSSENLRRLLQRRVVRAEMKGAVVPEEASDWIEAIVLEMRRLGYVDDKRFALSVAEKYRKAGKSRKYICQKLALAGISADMQASILAEAENDSTADSELEAALLLVKKRKLGLYRSEQDRALFRRKDLAVLSRAGFSYQTAVKALGTAAEEGEEYGWD